MGYTAQQVRTAVNALLKLYDLDPAAWRLLEEACYHVVQEKLLEMEDEEKKMQPSLEQETQEEEEPEPEQEQPQQQEPAVDEVPPQSNSSILEGHSAESAAIMSSDEEVEDPMLIEPHALEVIAPVAETKAIVPRFEATGTGETKTRPPCYGWLSESEDEEEQTSEQLPNPGSICKRKWLE
ncbi:unnamed protein product [Urochloa humidicola]